MILRVLIPFLSSDCLSLQEDLNNLVLWSTTWNLLFNEGKCSIVRVFTKCSPLLYDYDLSGKPVAVSTTHRDLGVVVSSDLKWKSHYDVVLLKAYKILGLLRHVFPLPFVLRQKSSLYFPCLVSVTVLFANLAATSLDRHQSIRRSSEKNFKIYSK